MESSLQKNSRFGGYAPPGGITDLAFVNYGGTAAYDFFQTNPPVTEAEERDFVKEVAPRMLEGVEAIGRVVQLYR